MTAPTNKKIVLAIFEEMDSHQAERAVELLSDIGIPGGKCLAAWSVPAGIKEPMFALFNETATIVAKAQE